MRSFIHKITAINLALIVLLSSFSIVLNKHFCGGEVANATFFVSADNCGMDMKVCKNDTSKNHTSIQKEPCCKDISEIIQGNDIDQQAIKAFQIEQISFLTAFIHTFITQFKEASVSFFVCYKPPLVRRNIQVFFQIFRI